MNIPSASSLPLITRVNYTFTTTPSDFMRGKNPAIMDQKTKQRQNILPDQAQ